MTKLNKKNMKNKKNYTFNFSQNNKIKLYTKFIYNNLYFKK